MLMPHMCTSVRACPSRTQRTSTGCGFIDLDVNGEVIGVELLDVSEGVNLDGLPYPDVITVLLEQQQVRVFA